MEQFDGEGPLLRTFRDSGRLGKVTAIAHWDGQWLLADAANRCIRRYDSQGAWLNDIGSGQQHSRIPDSERAVGVRRGR